MEHLWRVFGRCLAWVSLSVALTMLLWALASWWLNDQAMFWAFGISGVVCAFVGVTLWNFFPPQPGVVLEITHGFVLTIGVWLWIYFWASGPYYGSPLGLSWGDSLFYAISGLTTTGLSVLPASFSLGKVLGMWWVFLQWLGGFGLMLSLIVMVPLLRMGPHAIIPVESSDRTMKTSPKSVTMIQNMMSVYVGLTILVVVLLRLLGGMSWWESWTWSMACVSTGGITSTSQAIVARSVPEKWILSAAMIGGSVTFYWWLGCIQGHFSQMARDEQVRFAALWLTAIALIIGWQCPHLSWVDTITTACTALSGTGFGLGPLAVSIEPILMITTMIGGCSGSATGGCKLFRIHMLWRLTAGMIKKTTDARGFYPVMYQGVIISPQDLQVVVTIIVCYVVGWSLATLLLMMDFRSFDQAWSIASSAISNSGYVYDGWTQDGSQWSGWTKNIVMITMLFGRFEGLSLIGAGVVLWRQIKTRLTATGRRGSVLYRFSSAPSSPHATLIRGTKNGEQDRV